MCEDNAKRKARQSLQATAQYRAAGPPLGVLPPPDRPARPECPVLLAPKDMPRRRLGRSLDQRVALLHAIAHIELNAIDLAWDLVVRYPDENPPQEFYADWVSVGEDEAKHFLLLEERLTGLGSAYGDLPAHDGLWQAADDTAHDLLARLAIVPLVLEARGLDVTPAMITRMKTFGDHETADILDVIYRDEIGHVAIGKRWFDWVCGQRGLEPAPAWQDAVRTYFKGNVKPPFNEAARSAAGFPVAAYAGALSRS